MTGDTDQNSPDVKFARVERLVNPLTMDGQDPPYFPVFQPCSHYLSETGIKPIRMCQCAKELSQESSTSGEGMDRHGNWIPYGRSRFLWSYLIALMPLVARADRNTMAKLIIGKTCLSFTAGISFSWWLGEPFVEMVGGLGQPWKCPQQQNLINQWMMHPNLIMRAEQRNFRALGPIWRTPRLISHSQSWPWRGYAEIDGKCGISWKKFAVIGHTIAFKGLFSAIRKPDPLFSVILSVRLS